MIKWFRILLWPRVPHRSAICSLLFLVVLSLALPVHAREPRLTLTLQDVELREVMQMLSQQQRVNIMIAEGLEGKISVNLYDVELKQAIYSIADAAGYAVEERNGGYFVVEREEAGKYNLSNLTDLRTFKLRFTKPSEMEPILKKHLSSYGKITKLDDQRMLIVEDRPNFVRRISRLIDELDVEPKQILIEAKILQVGLTDDEAFGLDWSKMFSSGDGSGSFGTRGLTGLANSGLFFNLVNSNIEVNLEALKARGRLRTLSSPKLLALEHQEAFVIVGEEQGYTVTTTINQVTTESVEFLSSGIILRVTSWVNDNGEILMDISPEVSTGSVSLTGIPSKSTTQVSTHMLVADGQTVFIGGLIKQSVDQARKGVPVLGELPVVNLLFSNQSKKMLNTETVILITPKIVGAGRDMYESGEVASTQKVDAEMNKQTKAMRRGMDRVLNQNRWLSGQSAAEAVDQLTEPAPLDPGPTDEPWFLDYNR